jgi:hypothetical protein
MVTSRELAALAIPRESGYPVRRGLDWLAAARLQLTPVFTGSSAFADDDDL